MANQELSQVEQIKETIRVVDPLRRATVFGTAGIALHFGQREWPVATVSDVDLMTDPSQIRFMRARSESDLYIQRTILNQKRDEYRIPVGEAKLDIVPKEQFGLLPVNVVSSIKDNQYPMSWQEAYEQRIEAGGEFTLPLEVLLMWKIMAGRDKDVAAGELLTNFASLSGLIKLSAARGLREAIESQRTLKTPAEVK